MTIAAVFRLKKQIKLTISTFVCSCFLVPFPLPVNIVRCNIRYNLTAIHKNSLDPFGLSIQSRGNEKIYILYTQNILFQIKHFSFLLLLLKSLKMTFSSIK